MKKSQINTSTECLLNEEDLIKEAYGICPMCDGRGEVIDPDSGYFSRYEPCWNPDCIDGILSSHIKEKNE